MKNPVKIIIAILVVIVAVVAVLAITNGNKSGAGVSVNSAADLTALVDDIYAKVTVEMPSVMSQEIDLSDSDAVKMFTGLDSNSELEYVVVSEPMMSSQAYSLVLAKVKAGADVNKIAKDMNENVDARKWICVTAEKVYTTSSGDVICLVMSNEETAENVYNSFKKIAKNVGQEYERAGE